MIVRRHGHRSPHVVYVIEGSIWCGDRLCEAGTHVEPAGGRRLRAVPGGPGWGDDVRGDARRPAVVGRPAEFVAALRAEHAVEELPDPDIDFPDLADERADGLHAVADE